MNAITVCNRCTRVYKPVIDKLKAENERLKEKLSYCRCGQRAMNNMMGYSLQDPQARNGVEI